MAKQLFTNNATSKVAGAILASDTAVTFTSADDSKFPSALAAGEYFLCAMTKVSGVYEIIKVTSHTASSGTFGVIVRGQEGTAAMAISAGDVTAGVKIELIASAATFTDMARLAQENIFTATQHTGQGADVASATALTLGTDGNTFSITGTTAITSIATAGVGTVVLLRFAGILTLTHHATDLILPTGASITTAAGDTAIFEEYAAGDWRCWSYQRADGKALFNPLASTAETKTGTDAAKSVTPAGVRGALGFSEHKEFATSFNFAGIYQVAHGLSAIPKLWTVLARCTDAGGDAGYALNDEVAFTNSNGPEAPPGFANATYIGAVLTGTNYVVRYSATPDVPAMTKAKWTLVLRVWG